MRNIGRKIIAFLYNVYSFFAGFFLGRSKKNIIIGSWGGTTFSDNSRFLYQYLSENKTKFGLYNVVWATRSEEIRNKLMSRGYMSCLIGTRESKKWHLKSKTHVICNMYSDVLNFKPDIDTRYSCGAKKIQLWHGAGIKACGYLTNEGRKTPTWKKKIYSSNLYSIFTNGCWRKCFFVAISEENKRVAIEDYGYKPKRIIMGIYPRLCYSPMLFDDEKNVINKINEMHSKGKVILFLPTFRKEFNEYLPPEEIPGFEEWLARNDFFWVKKAHSVDGEKATKLSTRNVLILASNFDINILYDYVDMVVTDYSSASTDALFKYVRTLEYCPDFEYYQKHDRGFVNNFSKYHVFNPIIESKKLFEEIEHRINLEPKSIEKYAETRSFLFGDKQISISDFSKLLVGVKTKKEKENEPIDYRW